MDVFNLFGQQEWDSEKDQPGYRHRSTVIGNRLGATLLGGSLYELPPGEKTWPYHYELGEVEGLLVLEGRPHVRTPDGTEQLDRLDVAFFPTGPEGAHGIWNETDTPVRVLMWSSVVFPTATTYPDSDKVGVWTRDKADDLMVRRSSGVEYYDGEVPRQGGS